MRATPTRSRNRRTTSARACTGSGASRCPSGARRKMTGAVFSGPSTRPACRVALRNRPSMTCREPQLWHQPQSSFGILLPTPSLSLRRDTSSSPVTTVIAAASVATASASALDTQTVALVSRGRSSSRSTWGAPRMSIATLSGRSCSSILATMTGATVLRAATGSRPALRSASWTPTPRAAVRIPGRGAARSWTRARWVRNCSRPICIDAVTGFAARRRRAGRAGAVTPCPRAGEVDTAAGRCPWVRPCRGLVHPCSDGLGEDGSAVTTPIRHSSPSRRSR